MTRRSCWRLKRSGMGAEFRILAHRLHDCVQDYWLSIVLLRIGPSLSIVVGVSGWVYGICEFTFSAVSTSTDGTTALLIVSLKVFKHSLRTILKDALAQYQLAAEIEPSGQVRPPCSRTPSVFGYSLPGSNNVGCVKGLRVLLIRVGKSRAVKEKRSVGWFRRRSYSRALGGAIRQSSGIGSVASASGLWSWVPFLKSVFGSPWNSWFITAVACLVCCFTRLKWSGAMGLTGVRMSVKTVNLKRTVPELMVNV